MSGAVQPRPPADDGAGHCHAGPRRTHRQLVLLVVRVVVVVRGGGGLQRPADARGGRRRRGGGVLEADQPGLHAVGEKTSKGIDGVCDRSSSRTLN